MSMELSFPRGAIGTAYLLLRIQATMIALHFAITLGFGLPWLRIGVGALILALLLGCLTRASAGICALMLLAHFVFQTPSLIAGAQFIAVLALALVGGGAYSIDNLIFGRRVIRFRP